MNLTPCATDLLGRSSVVRLRLSAAKQISKPLLAGAFFAAVLASAFAVAPAEATNAVGTIAGSAGVGSTGAATYSIPISLPPGTNGMQPSVALVYNSQSGEGLAGYGWTLSGLSAITRCSKNIDDDGVTQAIQHSKSDDYCLDGQRLRLVSGTYGADGATYATVIQDFSLITSHVDASATGGPSWFTVQTKDGKTFEYGNTTDSKIFAQGTTVARVWALDKATDLNTNYYTATYQNNGSSTGEYWPLTINYTGNGSITPNHQISFGFQNRPAGTIQTSFEHGSLIINSQRLKTITVTYVPTNEATFTYALGYTQDVANGRNQLTSVKECGADGTCLPNTTIAWQSGQSNWGFNTPTGGGVSDLAHAQAAHLMDVDGDGIQDLVYPDTATNDWVVMFGLSGGGFTAPVDTGDPLYGDSTYYQYALALDYNGDGRMDLMVPIPSGWQVLVATGSRQPHVGNIFKTPGNNVPYLGGTNSVTNLPIYEGNAWALDFSGKGVSDLVYTDGTTMWLARNSGPAGGESFSAAQAIYTDNGLSKSVAKALVDLPLDFDGSGRSSALAVDTSVTPYRWEGFISTEQPTFLPMATFNGITLYSAYPAYPLDANADGLTDVMTTSSSGSDWQISLSTGAGFNTLASSIQNNVGVDSVVADYYGDGRKEAFVSDVSGTSWDLLQVYYSSTTGFTINASTGLSSPLPSNYAQGTLRVGNIEANGLDDLVFAEANTNGTYTWYYRLHNGGAADLVTSITNGLGSICQFQYASIAAGGPTYTEAGSPAVYPIRYAQSPMQVVSTYKESDGTGGTYSLNYTYTSARFESQGRGFLGFMSRSIDDTFRGTTETITYDQTFPWIGMVTSDVVTRNSDTAPISSTVNSGAEVLGYTGSNTCATICFPFFDTSVTTLSSNNGTANQTVSTTTTTLSQSSFDAYGNVIGEQTSVADAGTGGTFSSSQSASYSADTNSYCVGMVTGSSLTRTAPSGSLSRVTNGYPSTPSADVDTSHCRLNSMTTASGESDSTSLTTQYTYDSAFGNVIETDTSGTGVSPGPRTTKYDYTDPAGVDLNDEFPTTLTSVVSATPALSLVTHAAWYYDFGEQQTTTDANGLVTTYGYDGFGRLTSVTKPDGTGVQFTYVWCSTPGVTCPVNAVYEVTKSGSYPHGYTAYDMKGRPVEKETTLLLGAKSLVDTTYDSVGHAISVTRPYFSGQATIYKTTTGYDDAFNRVTSVTQPENAADTGSANDATTFSYNVVAGTGFGATVTRTVTGAGGGTQVTTKYTDALGEVVQMVDAKQGTTSYVYDAFGDLTQTTDADGNVTHLGYDGLGHKTSMSDPDMGAWAYQVDALGEVTCQTDADTQSTIMTYDGIGRVTNKYATGKGGGCNPNSLPTGTVTSTWTYDQAGALGLPASVSDSNGFQRSYGYDAYARPDDATTTINGTPYDISTSYDAYGRVQSVTYPASMTPAASTGPVASITPSPATVVVSTPLSLNGSGSTDPNGLPIEFAWSLTANPGFAGQLSSTDQTQTSFSANSPGNYTVQLQVTDADSAGTPASVAVTVQPPTPGAPTGTSPNYGSSANLTWNNVSTAGSYQLYQSTDGTNFTLIQTVTSGSGSTTTATVTGLTNGTYYFAVLACGNNICGARGPVSSAIGVVLAPATGPTGLSITPSPSNTGTYTLNWTAPSNPGSAVTSYEIFVSTTSGTSGFFNSATVTGNPPSTTQKFTGATSRSYWYYVTACNGAGCGPASNVVKEVVLLPPGTPGLTLSPTFPPVNATYVLSWTTPSGTIQNYILQESAEGGSFSNPTGWGITGNSKSFSKPTTGTWSYRVAACNSNNTNCSPWSTVFTVVVGCKTCSGIAFAGGAVSAPAPTSSSRPVDFFDLASATSPEKIFAGIPVPQIAAINAHTDATIPEVTSPDSPNHVAPMQSKTLSVLHDRRKALNGLPINEASEAQLQAMTTQRERQALPALAPQPPAADVMAWEKLDAKRDPAGPRYAAPAYLAYAGARIASATSTPYRFQVTYTYEPVGGALVSVQNAQTGFIYWSASTANGSIAPVDPFGHLLGYTDGNNVSTVNSYDAATGAITGISTGVGQSSSVQQLAYTWGAFGNLQQRCDANKGLMEAFTYDNLNRLSTSAINTGGTPGNCTTAGANVGPAIGVTYDAVGNIQTLGNSGNTAVGGTYTYGDPSHPQAVTAVSNITSGTNTYDANGNLICRFGTWDGTNCNGGTLVTWSSDNLPTQITGPNGSSSFSYGPDKQRYQQTGTDSSGTTTTTTYVGSVFEVVSTNSGTQYRHDIMANGSVVAVHTLDQNGNATTSYVHSDHLSSSDTLTNDQGNIATDQNGILQSMSFDAFGLRRDPSNWSYDLTNPQVVGLKSFTDRGFTFQEQLDNVGLVHMNGRLYDPAIGRMVSADPTIPDPIYSQAFDRYTYVYNNPLNMTDPSGFTSWSGVGQGIATGVAGLAGLFGTGSLLAGEVAATPFSGGASDLPVPLTVTAFVASAKATVAGFVSAYQAYNDQTQSPTLPSATEVFLDGTVALASLPTDGVASEVTPLAVPIVRAVIPYLRLPTPPQVPTSTGQNGNGASPGGTTGGSTISVPGGCGCEGGPDGTSQGGSFITVTVIMNPPVVTPQPIDLPPPTPTLPDPSPPGCDEKAGGSTCPD